MPRKYQTTPKKARRPTKGNAGNPSWEPAKGWQTLAAEQGVKPVEDFDAFLEEVGHVWPEEENLDDFLAWLRAARREGREDR